MAIQVTCPGCLKRFQVSDEFGGRRGPCPACKAEIEIPKAEDQVVIHGGTAETPRDSEGKLVLEPIVRKETTVSPLLWTSIIGGIVLVLALALMMRFSIEDKTNFPIAILALGAVFLAPPIAVAGYAFLRDDELEPFSGVELWIRASICGVIYAGLWALFAWSPGWIHMDYLETYHLAILGSAVAGVGAFAPVAVFDFEYLNGLIHYGFYLLVSIVLCLIMGYQGFMHAAPS